ncbi:hypothetical protein [Devosia ginsengisoli]|uniref:hypothetical protein n=1 Tax=Devosia ginsengisoli TaxID=400770 RepID=UPI0016487931|nr:hypothetical protein [Devosia ginsengisoli]
MSLIGDQDMAAVQMVMPGVLRAAMPLIRAKVGAAASRSMPDISSFHARNEAPVLFVANAAMSVPPP